MFKKGILFLSLMSSLSLFGMEEHPSITDSWIGLNGYQDFVRRVAMDPVAQERIISFLNSFFAEEGAMELFFPRYRPIISNIRYLRFAEGEDGGLGVAAHAERESHFEKVSSFFDGKGIDSLSPSCNYVIQHPDFPRVVLTLAKFNWYTSEFRGKRCPWQVVSRPLYHLQIKKVVEERGLSRIETGDMWLFFVKEEGEEPTDDRCLVVSEFIDRGEGEDVLTFTRLFGKACQGHEPSLELISHMVQVIYWSGLWNVKEQDVLFGEHEDGGYKAFFSDVEQPGIGGNPWRDGEGGIAPLWETPKESYLYSNVRCGMKEFANGLLGLPKDPEPQEESAAYMLREGLIAFASQQDCPTRSLFELLWNVDALEN